MIRIRIATRQSRLALWQAEHARARLLAEDPGLAVELLPLTTRGDQILDQPLARIGGKGLFLKELEQALLDGRADIAVHSMKDVPAEVPEGLGIAAVLEREEPHDALVSERYPSLEALPAGARIGTSSLRRQCQLAALRPDLQIASLRGNLDTRLRKLDEGEYDAIILAAAGLVRLGLGERIRARLEPAVMLPAIAQGAIGIECRSDDGAVIERLRRLGHPETEVRVAAERALNRRLAGSCQVPLAGHAELAGGRLSLRALVGRADGSQILRAEQSGPQAEAEAIGDAVGRQLLEAGAGAIIEALKESS